MQIPFSPDRRQARRIPLNAAALLLLAMFSMIGCDVFDANREGTDPDPTEEVVTGEVVFVEPGTNRLFVQALDGTGRRQLHFQNIQEALPRQRENGAPVVPIPTDETVRWLGNLRWSPDGERVALTVSSTEEKFEVIILEADGSGGRTATPETKHVNAMAWSPDGTRLAYTMAESDDPADMRLYVIDLLTNTTAAPFPDEPFRLTSELRWDREGTGIYFTRQPQTSSLSTEILHAHLASGTIREVLAATPGYVTDIDPIGETALLVRPVGMTSKRELVRIPLGSGEEEVFVTNGVASYALFGSGTDQPRHALFFGKQQESETEDVGYLLTLQDRTLLPLNGLDKWTHADVHIHPSDAE